MKRFLFSIFIGLNSLLALGQPTASFDHDNFALFWRETISYDDLYGTVAVVSNVGIYTIQSASIILLAYNSSDALVPGGAILTNSGETVTIANQGGTIAYYRVSFGITYTSITNPDPQNAHSEVRSHSPYTTLITTNIGSVCQNSSPINLNNYVNHTGGTFSGTGVSGSTFTPTSVGTHTITYHFCYHQSPTFTVTVKVLPTGSFPDRTICNNTNINLSTVSSHTGTATFLGTGVSGTTFSPTTAGIGDHTLTMNLSLNSCYNSYTATYSVEDLKPATITFDDVGGICINGSPVNLNTLVSYSGGSFSGDGVSGTTFDPGNTVAGIHPLTYTVGNSGCEVTLNSEANVYALPELYDTNIDDVCLSTPIDLAELDPSIDETFSGAGVTNNQFYPAVSQDGRFTISVNYTTPEGCLASNTFDIDVEDYYEPNVTFNAIPDQCTANERFLLSNYINNYDAYGTFNGTGVSLGYFYPSDAGSGTFELAYRRGSGACLNEQTILVDVHPSTLVNFTDIPIQCSANTINLADYVDQSGGTFSGNGVSGNYFEVETAGIGNHEIIYSYTNGNNCTSVTPYTIRIDDLLPSVNFSFSDNICNNIGLINLFDYVDYNSGVFSGSGVSNNHLDPTKLNEGTSTVTYSYGSGSCSTDQTETFYVRTSTSVIFTDIPIQCSANNINLADYVDVSGGTFSGTGVTGNYFSVETAGIGNHEINYSYTNGNSCTSLNPYTIRIDDILPSVSFNLPDNICNNSPRMYLFDYVNYSYGSFSGDGVDLNYLEPDNLSDGLHSVSFDYGSNSCRSSISETFTIIQGDEITTLDIPNICEGSTIYLPDFVSPKNGTFTGTGVDGDYFNSESTGFGSYTLNYTVTSGCTSTTPLKLFVRPAISADFYANDSSINESRYVKFIPYTDNTEYQYYWTFGDNSFSTELKPIHYYYHPGEHTVSLTITDNENICSNNLTKENFIHVSTLTSSEEINSIKDHFKILPFGNIQFLKAGRYRITDLTGRILLRGKNQVETIHVPLNTGIYIICVEQGRNYLAKRFFID